MELCPYAAGIFDTVRPDNDHALSSAPEVRCHLLGPLERRVEGPSPAHGVMRKCLIGAPGVIPFHLLVSGHRDAVEGGELIGSTESRAFRTGSVVAADVEGQRVVELTHIFDGLDYTTDLVVGVSHIAGIDFSLPGVHLLLFRRQ